jgi:hypothetical protein
MNTWEAIFSQSPVNQGYYNEAGLPQNHWGWQTVYSSPTAVDVVFPKFISQ